MPLICPEPKNIVNSENKAVVVVHIPKIIELYYFYARIMHLKDIYYLFFYSCDHKRPEIPTPFNETTSYA